MSKDKISRYITCCPNQRYFVLESPQINYIEPYYQIYKLGGETHPKFEICVDYLHSMNGIFFFSPDSSILCTQVKDNGSFIFIRLEDGHRIKYNFKHDFEYFINNVFFFNAKDESTQRVFVVFDAYFYDEKCEKKLYTFDFSDNDFRAPSQKAEYPIINSVYDFKIKPKYALYEFNFNSPDVAIYDQSHEYFILSDFDSYFNVSNSSNYQFSKCFGFLNFTADKMRLSQDKKKLAVFNTHEFACFDISGKVPKKIFSRQEKIRVIGKILFSQDSSQLWVQFLNEVEMYHVESGKKIANMTQTAPVLNTLRIEYIDAKCNDKNNWIATLYDSDKHRFMRRVVCNNITNMLNNLFCAAFLKGGTVVPP